MKKIFSIIFSVSTLAFVTNVYADGHKHPVTGEMLADDQTFTYWALDEHSSIDPQIVEDVGGSDIVRDLFEGLLNQDADGNLVPGVAETWSANDSKDVYTFNLRKNAKWSNGDSVTAHDFVYAWQRAVDPATASPYSWFMEIMSIKNGAEAISGDVPPSDLGVKAIDDYTFQVELTASLPYFAAMTTHATTFPTHKGVIEKHGSDWTKPGNMVSNGAYVLTEHVINERLVRERNPMYWNNDDTILEKVVALVIPDENQGLTRYMAGELDKGPVPTGQFKKLKAEYPDQAVSFPRLCNYYYTFNLSDSGIEAFQDVRVRKAMAYAIDRNVITEDILQAGQIPAYTFTPGATAGFDVPSVAFSKMSQDERDARAVELMEEAGYGKDNPLSFTMIYNTSEGHKKIATVMAQMWKQKLGINATMENTEWKTFLDIRGKQDFEIARGAWCGDYNEASTFLDLLTTPSGYNDGKFTNAAVDKLMTDAKTAGDSTINYTTVERILAAEMPVIPIYHYAGVFMLNKQLKGWPFDNVEQNWYSRNLYKIAK